MSSSSSNNMNIGLGSYRSTYEYDDVINMENNNNISTGIVSPSAIGLRLGNTKDYGDSTSTFFHHNSTTKNNSSTTPTKRSRASYQNMQNPCCQVEGCNLDLKSAKDYHRRHRICESHSKSPKVVVAGMERRFCQQCSRFHDLSEFDDKKRSCRRRLSDHNARRRRVPPDSMQLTSAGLSSALYETDHRANNMLLNGLPISLSNSTWGNGSTSARDSLIRPSLCFSGDHIHNPISSLQTTSNIPRGLGQCLHAPTSYNSTIAPDLLSANSLLSSSSWSFNEGKIGNSMEGLVHGNDSNPAGSDYNNILNPDEQGPHVSFLHEYQLLSKSPGNYF